MPITVQEFKWVLIAVLVLIYFIAIFIRRYKS